MHIRIICHVALLSMVLLFARNVRADALVWCDLLSQARSAATNQHKLILLMAGRHTCGHCQYMQTNACEAPNVRPLIDEIYVPWFCEIDESSQWNPYAVGLEAGWSLPLICVIDPANTSAWLYRRTGVCTPTTLENNLRLAARLAPPKPDNLVAKQVIRDNRYEVTGHIWTNLEPTGVFYRVCAGTNVVPFIGALGGTNWIAALAPYVLAGASNQYTFDLYAEFSDETRSPTNRVLFSYVPIVTPASPRITSVTRSNGIITLSLTNLTVGCTARLESCYELASTNAWTPLTNFVCGASACRISDPVNWLRKQTYYRVSIATAAPPGQ